MAETNNDTRGIAETEPGVIGNAAQAADEAMRRMIEAAGGRMVNGVGSVATPHAVEVYDVPSSS